MEKAAQDPIWGNDILDYDWYKARALIDNPNVALRGTSPENPQFLLVDQVRSMNYSLDGIFHLPAGSQILNSSGTTSPYVPGSPCNAHGCSTVGGGSFQNDDSGIPSSWISPDSSRDNLFGYVEHEGSWRTRFEAAQLGKKLVWHRRFGWLPKDHVDRYEKGERLLGARWVSAAADADASPLSAQERLELDLVAQPPGADSRARADVAERRVDLVER